MASDIGEPMPFHEGQLLAYNSTADIIAFLAGSQSGKTAFSPWWMVKEIERCGPGDYLAVTATYDMFKLKMLPAYIQVMCDILKIGKYWAVDKIIELRPNRFTRFEAERSQDHMWGRLILRSAQAPGGLESATALAVHADEAGQDEFGIGAWRAITRRLYARRGRILVTSTLYNLGWLKQQLIDPVMTTGTTLQIPARQGEIQITSGTTGERSIDLIQIDSIVNPAFPIESWEDAKATMPADDFDLFFRGRVTRLRSLVYDVFEFDLHTCDSFDPPPAWPRYVGIDPVGDRTAATWFAWDREHLKLHCYREYCAPFGQTTMGHAQAILALGAKERIFGYVGGGPSERQARVDWQAAGVPIEEPPITDVWVGIQRVYSLIKTGNLVFHRCCEGVISELGSMRRKKVDDNFTMAIVSKELFHCLDSVRYAVAAIADAAPQQKVIYQPLVIGEDI